MFFDNVQIGPGNHSNILLNGYRGGSFSGLSGQGVKLTTPPSSGDINNEQRHTPPFPHMPVGSAQGTTSFYLPADNM